VGKSGSPVASDTTLAARPSGGRAFGNLDDFGNLKARHAFGAAKGGFDVHSATDQCFG
jgi:hypothetical protein